MLLSGLTKDCPKTLRACVRAGVTADDLYSDPHRRAFAALVACRGDMAAAFRTLCRTGDAGLCWGGPGPLAAWLAEVWEADPTGCSCDYAAAVVKQLSVRRQVIHRANEVLRDSYARVYDPGHYAELLERLSL